MFEGCFTTSITSPSKWMSPAWYNLRDQLQPEWANIRFSAAAPSEAGIGQQTRYGRTVRRHRTKGSLPCQFELGPLRMWGVGSCHWAGRGSSARMPVPAPISYVTGATHSAFAHFAGLNDTTVRIPEAGIEEQYAALVSAMARLMRPTRDDARIRRVHAALVASEHASVHDSRRCLRDEHPGTLERVCMRYFRVFAQAPDAAPALHAKSDQFHAPTAAAGGPRRWMITITIRLSSPANSASS